MFRIQKLIYQLYMNCLHLPQIKLYQELVVNQELSLEELEVMQLEKLNNLLNYSYENVPYYRKILNSCGFVDNGKINLNSLKQLEKVPLMTKDIIRKQRDNLYSLNHKQRKSFKNSSGGTTGEPVVILQDIYYSDRTRASFLLGKKWQGLSLYDSEIVLWGAARDTYTGKKPFISKFKDFITNSVLLNCFVMSKNDMKRYLKIINKNSNTVLRGYAETLYEFSKFAKKSKIKIRPLKAVHSTAGNLKKFMRTEIESVFNCKIYNYYGTREVGAIASECSEQDGLHIFMDHNILEILNPEGEVCKPGERGEIVITNLNNYSMPLIRYKIGDVGVYGAIKKCDCGCSYPKLASLTGKTNNLFIKENGTIIDSDFITPSFYFSDWIEKFQIIQKKYDKILVKIVKNGDCKQGELDDVVGKFKKVMGENCEVMFEFVKEIPKTKTGKILYTICEVEKS